jgi:hypothetical protein
MRATRRTGRHATAAWQTLAENGRQKRHDALVLALAAGRAVRSAAASAGVSERTAFRRLADPAFRRQVHEARAALVQQAVGKLAEGMAEAADVLRGLLQAEADGVKLSAARTILETGHRLREACEVDERLRALEAQLEAAQTPQPPTQRC